MQIRMSLGATRVWILSSLFMMLMMAVAGQEKGNSPDWNQWRGPDRSGTWYHAPEVDYLTSDRVEPVWDVPLGPGYCGPTVAGGRVYVMDYEQDSERVHCFRADNGELEWSFTYPVVYNMGYPTGPRASVLIQDGKAYTWGAMGHLYCLHALSGNVLWHVNTLEKYQSRIPIWGFASNPILLDEQIIVQVGGSSGASLVAFHKETGQERWRALEDEASYSAPVLIRQAGKPVVVCWTGGSITGLNPENGQVYWSIPFEPWKSIINIADPVYDPPHLFLSSFYDGSFLVKLDQDHLSAELVYHRRGKSERETDALHCCMSTPLIRNGFVYGIDSYGETRCLDLLTGDRIWEDQTLVPKARWANVHFMSHGDKVWGFNELGILSLGRFTPEGYVDLGKVQVIEPVRVSPNPRNGICWAHPACAGNRIYVRSDGKLACMEIQ
jgi:outer membrane protein assembly factor BamB